MAVCLLVSAALSSRVVKAGIRAPGKYSGVVVFDRWGGCILFSGVYLMYISETIKDQVRQYEGQAIEINALEVHQPINPGDGLIRRLSVLGTAESKETGFTVQGIHLDAQPVAINDRLAVKLTITNESDTPARIDSSQIGLLLLTQKIEGALTPSDGPSMAVITRTNVFTGKGSSELGTGDRIYSYSYVIADDARLPPSFDLPPHESRSTQIGFELPPGHYQFFAGYGGGVHESKSIVSNPVSIDLWQ
jgi:hypothetical protein